MSFLSAAKVLLPVSLALMIVSAVLFFVPGPKLSLEFTGGTLLGVSIPEEKTKEDLRGALDSYRNPAGEGLGNFSISTTRSGIALVRTRDLNNEEHIAVLDHLNKTIGNTEERQFTTIGPTVGSSLKTRSVWALLIASVGIVAYIFIAFRNVPRRLSPLRFGLFAVFAMLHDLLITTGIFIVIGWFTNFELDTLFVTALLTILGYSVNDTIIIFDRIRENVAFQGRGEDFRTVADRSLRETFTRTMNTSITTLIMLFALLFLGSESIRWFILTLIIGICLGNYSSYFVATPLLVSLRKKT